MLNVTQAKSVVSSLALLATLVLANSTFASNSDSQLPFSSVNQAASDPTFIDFKAEVLQIPCLLIKNAGPEAEGSFYSVKMVPQFTLKASKLDWKVVKAELAPECKEKQGNPFAVAQEQTKPVKQETTNQPSSTSKPAVVTQPLTTPKPVTPAQPSTPIQSKPSSTSQSTSSTKPTLSPLPNTIMPW